MLDKTHVEAFCTYLSTRQCSPLTVRNYRVTITMFLKIVDKHPRDVTIEDIEDYVQRMLTDINDGKPYSNNSLCSKFCAMKSYIEYLNYTYHKNNPIQYDDKKDKFLHPPMHINPDKDVLTKEEVSRIFAVAKNNKRDIAVLKTLFFSGQRKTSIQMIDLEDIDWQNETVTIRFATKQKKGKRIHLAPLSGAIQSIKDYIENSRETPLPEYSNAVFLNGYGMRMCNETINAIVKKYSVLAGITKRNYPHLWRASFITICDAGGMTRDQIKTVTGHKDTKSLDTYLKPDPTECMKKAKSILSLDGEDLTSPQPIPIPIPQKPKLISEQPETYYARPITNNQAYSYEVLYEGV